MTASRSGGFTLIELMIVVAVMAILAAVAYPSYTGYVTRASREAAKSELLQLASVQEKIYLNSNRYAVGATAITAAYNGRDTGGLGVTSGRTSDNKYNITIAMIAASDQTYTITATPVAGTSQANDGTISIDSAGVRSGTICCATW